MHKLDVRKQREVHQVEKGKGEYVLFGIDGTSKIMGKGTKSLKGNATTHFFS